MKKYLIITLLLVFTVILNAATQDDLNVIYLDDLDQKLIDTIDLIISFNNSANNMIGIVDGAEEYSKYLLSITMDTTNLRTTISESLDMLPSEREETIWLIMASLQPEPIDRQTRISSLQDQENSDYLEQRLPKITEQLTRFRRQIINEEIQIAEKRIITEKYLTLHNRHFIYQLLYCFSLDQHLLSRGNRQYLVDLIKLIDRNIYGVKL